MGKQANKARENTDKDKYITACLDLNNIGSLSYKSRNNNLENQMRPVNITSVVQGWVVLNICFMMVSLLGG